jgi:hypothetical protein
MPASDASQFSHRLQEAISRSSVIFERRHVLHALIGGLAVGLRARPRTTFDVDLIVSLPQLQLPAVLDEFVEAGFAPSARELITQWNSGHMAVLWYDDVRVDWLKPVLPLYQHVIDRSEPLTIADHPFHVATTEGLILCKLVADRPRDRADILDLLEASEANVDLAYIESEWQTIGSFDDPRILELKRMIDSVRVSLN